MYIQNFIYLIAIGVIIFLLGMLGIKNAELAKLRLNNKELECIILEADNKITLQNEYIKNMAIEEETNIQEYKANMINLEAKYKEKLRLTERQLNMKCEEQLQAINSQQMEFLR